MSGPRRGDKHRLGQQLLRRPEERGRTSPYPGSTCAEQVFAHVEIQDVDAQAAAEHGQSGVRRKMTLTRTCLLALLPWIDPGLTAPKLSDREGVRAKGGNHGCFPEGLGSSV